MTNQELLLSILRDEIAGDIQSALGKMSKDYSMTWMYKKGEVLFPSSSPDFSADMKDVYPIKGRKYKIKNIAEGEDVVMIEVIESYPDPKTGRVYRTPLVIVVEIRDGKIFRGRHYCDPDISWLHLEEKEIEDAYKGSKTRRVIE